MSKILTCLLVIILTAVGVFAQTQGDLKRQSEAKHLTKKYIVSHSRRHVVVELGPRTTYLKEGLSSEAVMKVLGKPLAISQRTENGNVVTTYEFPRAEGRILIAEFIDNTLIHSRTAEASAFRAKVSG